MSLQAGFVAKKPVVEVVFVLDTTGSMSGMINTAKDKIWSIATSLTQSTPQPEIKMGLIAYRDRGDKYVTKVVDLNGDLDSVYDQLIQFKARGGGDSPESVNQALYEAVEDISWSKSSDAYRVIFLIGDQPPHLDYANDVQYQVSCRLATKNDIAINTIQMGNVPSTSRIWKEIAHSVNGEYIKVGMNANGVQIQTPYDDDIARYTDELENKRVYYGTEIEKKRSYDRVSKSIAMKEKLSTSVKARRSSFNFSKSGKANLYGKNELIEDIKSNKVNLDTISRNHLPKVMQKMDKKERKNYILKISKERKVLKNKILSMQKKRKEFISKKLKGKKLKNSFSYKIYNAIKKQAKQKGILYKKDVQN